MRVGFEGVSGRSVKQTLPLNNVSASYIFGAIIPPSAWHGNSTSFTIRINRPDKIAESNEDNEVVNSFWLDPEG